MPELGRTPALGAITRLRLFIASWQGPRFRRSGFEILRYLLKEVGFFRASCRLCECTAIGRTRSETLGNVIHEVSNDLEAASGPHFSYGLIGVSASCLIPDEPLLDPIENIVHRIGDRTYGEPQQKGIEQTLL